MFATKNTRLEAAPLNRVAFYADLPVLLGCSVAYAKHLCNPPSGDSGRSYREAKFPKPVYVSPSGVRVWLVKDIESWLRTRRPYLMRKRLRANALLHRPERADEILGR